MRETVGDRVDKAIKLMNQGRNIEIFSRADIARYIGLDSVGELENIIKMGQNVPFKVIESFNSYFGVNEKWLSDGSSNPFFSMRTTSDPLWHVKEFETENPIGIYFIREISKDSRVMVVLKLLSDTHGNGVKFKLLNAPWHICGNVGAGGQSQIVSFYQLILMLKEKNHYGQMHGREVSPEIFSMMNGGEIFAGQVIDGMPSDNPWWDDFTDINGRYDDALGYSSRYDKWFHEAQSIVRNKLKKQ